MESQGPNFTKVSFHKFPNFVKKDSSLIYESGILATRLLVYLLATAYNFKSEESRSLSMKSLADILQHTRAKKRKKTTLFN